MGPLNRLIFYLLLDWWFIGISICLRAQAIVALSKCLPAKYDSHKKRLLEEALKLFDKIPSPIDRLSHYEGYASAASKDSVASAKETLKRALLLSSEIEDNARAERHRRELIDIADRIDPALAEKLIEQIDDDPARAHAKSELKRSAAVVKTKREIANAKEIKDVASCDRTLLPAAAWKNVAALLAGRLETKSSDVMSEYVQISCVSELHSSYPMLAWFIENAACKYTQATEVADYLVPLCEGLLNTMETTLAVLSVAASQNTLTVDFPSDASDGLIVTPRDRAHALQYIREWLRANAVDYVKFSDPYFGPGDIQFLRMILAECPECKVFILTSKRELQKQGALDAETFLAAWSKLIDQDPPETEILAIGSDGDEKALIHDRWIISKGCGLRIGTSFNSIGEGKLSEISMMEPSKASQCEHHLNQFLERQRIVNGQKVAYLGFTL
jgi:GTP cyclohydrolase I